MLATLDILEEYMYYFQFSVTPYGNDIEPNLPSKTDVILPAFKKLSEIIGTDRVIWRYDPILINAKYTIDYHMHAFSKIAKELHRHTKKVTISFIDTEYKGVKSNLSHLALHEFTCEMQIELASQLAKISYSYGLEIDTCAEKLDLQQHNISRAVCIDSKLISKLLGSPFSIEKDKNQRKECGCVSAIDIGAYNSCLNGCKYCYANYNPKTTTGNYEKHNPLSPVITGFISADDKINERIVKSYRDTRI